MTEPQIIKWSIPLPWRHSEAKIPEYPCWVWELRHKFWAVAYGSWHVGFGLDSYWMPWDGGRMPRDPAPELSPELRKFITDYFTPTGIHPKDYPAFARDALFVPLEGDIERGLFPQSFAVQP